MKEQTKFIVDKTKCIKCGNCVNTCSGMVLEMGSDGFPFMKDFERYGWRGCWRCEHCLAVCPTGAISIFGKKPEDSLPMPNLNMGYEMQKLISTRRSCRRYLKQNVDSKIIDEILKTMYNAPTGGNSSSALLLMIRTEWRRLEKLLIKKWNNMQKGIFIHIASVTFIIPK